MCWACRLFEPWEIGVGKKIMFKNGNMVLSKNIREEKKQISYSPTECKQNLNNRVKNGVLLKKSAQFAPADCSLDTYVKKM